MTDPESTPRHGVAALLEDWVTIWRSEMAAMATDRELHEAMQRMADAWGAQARLLARATGAAFDNAAGPAGPLPPSRPAPAGPAPDGRDAVIADLLARVQELERRLARNPPP